MRTGLHAKVLDGVNVDEVIRLTQQLVARPSVTGDEAAVASFMAHVLQDMGLDVECKDAAPGRPNVVGTLAGPAGGRTLVMNGHMDVVPPGDGWTQDPFGGKLIDGRIYGRGAVDMKAGLAAMIGAVAAVQRAGVALGGTAVLIGAVGEELDQLGTRRLVEEGLRADFGIVCEPTLLAPAIAHKGDLHYEIRVRGRQAHSSNPKLGLNAIDKMADIIVALRGLAVELARKHHPHLGSPTLSVGMIQGGTDTCVVPGDCVVSVDRRLLPNEAVEEADDEMRRLLARLSSADSDLDAHVRRTVTAPAMEISPETAVAQAARRASTEVLGYDPGFTYKAGTTDANWLVNAAGIPTVLLGPGNPAQAHQADEFVETEQIWKASRVLALMMVDLLGTR
ncbi:MAG: M20 family metallopeptidase [Candidatus Methylomirabilota bacterium]|jgi:acetylornithine deacetylase/succinyl-diaminopimelate desuccinylase family protein